MNMHDAACPAGLSPAQPTKHVKPMMTVVEEQPRRPSLVQQTTVSILCTPCHHHPDHMVIWPWCF